MDIGVWWLKPIPIGAESWLGFAVVLIALIIFIWLIGRLVTRVTEDSDPAETDRQMLTAVNDLHRKGDLSQEEFRSIKSQLVDRLHQHHRSSADGSEEIEGGADLTESTVSTSAPVAIETQDTIVDSATRADLPTSSEDSTVDDQEPSDDGDRDS